MKKAKKGAASPPRKTQPAHSPAASAPKKVQPAAAQTAAPVSTSPEAAQRGAMANKLNVGFAQFVTLMMRHQAYRNNFIAELEWSLVPPISLRQFLVTEVRDPAQGVPIAVAGVLWARVSKEVDARLAKTAGRIKLAPAEWASGDIPWLVDAIGDRKYTAMLIKHLAEDVFAKQGLRALERGADGKAVVRVLGPSEKKLNS